MRTHFYTSAESPKFGTDLTAVCGQVVPNAQPLDWFDRDNPTGKSLMCNCRKCNSASVDINRYEAIIVSGQEALVAKESA